MGEGVFAGSDRTGSGDEPREVRGTVKWFDQTKGYGFITPDDGGSDIMIHSSCLRSSGVENPEEGDAITCEAIRRDKGLQATKILNLTCSEKRPVPSQIPPRDLPDGPLTTVTVKWFSRAKGYGFLQEEGSSEDIFVHMETVRAGGFSELETGQRLDASLVRGPKGWMAKAVAPHRAH
ncbi:cold-shock protein [Parvularcula maris]|uniref:CspA family cold shock protein n=1 Tax=Parvularcula maris TaxID=2965077 RepID=A0A9X2L7J9_9PROT|nr:cold-shock protein [Parvularcula maris]MCQ8184520.1 CspA family cold shock protein [Parvularcula maris]